ncbi:hypothetical protein B0A52_03714 [Exophiala mesophila]|uniref:FAD-binding domain-containing protein n=1 Tax=Exophiala mesophila TaxID=212818 RepID=A0A438NA84_EXOME|nr:hypothetical protein B0A52_03714 [Exophiala mesophila]
MQQYPQSARSGLIKDAPRPLRVIICGGGLGGLGAAIALRHKGHEVIVLESALALSEIGAGIQIPPNSTRILDAYYGLGDKLRVQVAWPQKIAIKRYATGTILGRTPLHPQLSEKYGYPYWLIHRADYQRILYDEAVALGAQVILAALVTSIDQEKVSVTTSDGTEYLADVVVGADGIRSKVREFVLPDQKAIQPNPTANCAYRATVPAEVMRADPDTAQLMTDLNSNAWIGHQRHVMAYPIRQGAMYNLVMCHPGQAKPGVWNEPGDVQQMRETYATFDPVIRKVIDNVTSCLRWTLADLPPLPTWLSQSGKVVLIGDAAHAMVPFLAQGASMSIEDGPALAECLSRVRELEDIPKYLRVFEQLRKPRCEKLQLCSRLNGQMWHLPDGPQQEERDRGFERDDFAKAETEQSEQESENVNPWSDRNFQPWLFGYDIVKETRKALDEIDGTSLSRAGL